MEKSCEFCTALRPMVYCQADAAYLCLSCDAEVHSANALSNRHLRTLLCDSCRRWPACSRCLDHQMFVCRSCDRSLHGLASQHRRRSVSSYVGCPSANDFAALWGFELDNLDRNAVQNQFLSTGACNVETKIRSSSQQFEFSFNGLQPQETSFISQQILDLKKLQLNEANSGTPSGSEEGRAGMMTFSTPKKHDDDLDRLSVRPLRELKVDVSTSPFSQTEPASPFHSANTNPLVGESFWQSISPRHMNQNQLWSQNMQDIGVCDEIVSHDNFDVPDVDKSFSNFEELFEGDKDVTGAQLDASCSAFSSEDAYASSIYMRQSLEADQGHRAANQAYIIQGSPNALRETHRPSYDMEASPVEARENAMTRYKEKKKTRRNENQVRLTPRRPGSDVRK